MELFGIETDLDRWFAEALGDPTAIQERALPILRAGGNALLVAATGQGKSLAAWRPLVERIAARPAGRGVRALHVAPLKSLARDMTSNLGPLLTHAKRSAGRPLAIALRCGDTPPAERARQRRNPPEILSTTPESLFVLLGSDGGRHLLGTVEAVVVDELHALVDSKRGAHLALSLARLDRLVPHRLQRIGLSATARPTKGLADFLSGGSECEVVEPAPPGGVDLRVELPGTGLGPFPTTAHWAQIHARIAAMAMADRSSGPERRGAPGASEGASDIPEVLGYAEVAPCSLLVFCQTRAQVERTAAALDELLAEAGLADQVGAHHGSLDASHREAIEARFKSGGLRVMVSSASLELGLDLGHVDRVCQIGIPGSVNLVRQRAGRSAHRPGGTPCMHLFPLTLNQLVEAHALQRTLARGVIEEAGIRDGPMDVLAQHLAAMAAAGIDRPDDMLALARSAWPYRALEQESLEDLLALLSEPVAAMPERQVMRLVERRADGACVAKPHAGRLVLTNAGTIPEFFEYDVVRADTGEKVGTLDEEFAFESSPGQVVQLGRRAWRILRVSTGRVRVEPTEEPPGELPFWFGEGPGRTPEMASAIKEAMATAGSGGLEPQAAAMLAEARGVLGALPSADRLIIERFPDPNGDRHVVLHTFAGARINRAWGLALRKRFCRQFNFELQAAATDDGILISLGVTSAFDVADVVRFVRSESVEDVLTQALLDTPLFVTRFRWVANNALVLLKNGLDGPVPAQRQRSQAENLIACVFPDQLACLENLSGPREVPDHPLVGQALADCLHDYMDLPGLKHLLARIESGELAVHAVDLPAPSRLAEALIHAPRYSYLDEAAAEERRTRNFEHAPGRGGGSRAKPATRRRPQVDASRAPLRRSGRDGVRPSADALARMLDEAGFLTAAEGEAGIGLQGPLPAGGWTRWFSQLVREKRAVAVSSSADGPGLWVGVERLGGLLALNPALQYRPWISPSLVNEAPGPEEGGLQWLAASRRRVDARASEVAVARLLGLPDDRRGRPGEAGVAGTERLVSGS
ncbi:MAG: DEAD/DEAH box helicase [Candidatus Wenzhouxiangella sp. M2_3B_020]